METEETRSRYFVSKFIEIKCYQLIFLLSTEVTYGSVDIRIYQVLKTFVPKLLEFLIYFILML